MSDLRRQAAATVLRRQREQKQAEIDAEEERLRVAEEQRRLAAEEEREKAEAVARAVETVPAYDEAVRSFLGELVGLGDAYEAVVEQFNAAYAAIHDARTLGARGLPDLAPSLRRGDAPVPTFTEFLEWAVQSWTPDEYQPLSRAIDRARKETS